MYDIYIYYINSLVLLVILFQFSVVVALFSSPWYHCHIGKANKDKEGFIGYLLTLRLGRKIELRSLGEGLEKPTGFRGPFSLSVALALSFLETL